MIIIFVGIIYKKNALKHSYPYVKKSFKTQLGRIPIDPAILAAMGHRFIAKKKKEKCWCAGRRQRGRRPETGDVFLPKPSLSLI